MPETPFWVKVEPAGYGGASGGCSRAGVVSGRIAGVSEDEAPIWPGRHETAAERSDRNWHELLQELRVLQTGVQLLAGFLVTLPFQSRFGDLDSYQRDLYAVVLCLAVLTTLLMMVPIAVHRRLFRAHVKERLVVTGHRLLIGVLVTVALLMAGVVMLVLDVVMGRTAGWLGGASVLLVSVGLLWLVPAQVASASSRVHPPE